MSRTGKVWDRGQGGAVQGGATGMGQTYPGFLTVPSGCVAQKPWEAGCTAVSYGRDWEKT